MIISHQKKFIFIHNYKVAGTSIRHALEQYANLSFKKSRIVDKWHLLTGNYPSIYSEQFPNHTTAASIKEILPDSIFKSYFKFGFVRNPWDWQVSLYSYMLKEEGHYQHDLAKSFHNFTEYLEWRVANEARLQKNFFYDEKGNCLMDYIGKFENINEEMEAIGNRLGLNFNLQHLNKSREADEIKDYYDQYTIKLVNKAYQEDIVTFGYKPPVI